MLRETSLSKFLEEIPVLFHDAICDIHFAGHFFIIGRQADAIWGFGDGEGVAFGNAEFFEEFLGQDDAGGVSNRGDF